MIKDFAQYFGYLASVFLIISLVVNGDTKFRIYNLLGCGCFIIYGFILNAWPVILTNTILLLINLYYLRKLHLHRENFELIEVNANEKITEKFIQFYKEDIMDFYKEFDIAQLKDCVNFMVLRDLVIANIFCVKMMDNGDALVVLNYTIKKYRDYKVSKFIFNKNQLQLSAKGIKRILFDNTLAVKYKKYFDLLDVKSDGKYFYKTLQ
jgi:hypothetical protein